jgi:protein-S-isoprenylcysteine O-methyltransferase Ste14
MTGDASTAQARLRGVQKLRIRVLWAALLFIVPCVVFCASAWGAPTGGFFSARGLMTAAGLALISAAVLGRVWSTLYIGGRKAAEIVTKGPYSICRNPLYAFSLTGVLGAGLLSGSFIMAAVFLATAYLVFSMTIRQEEEVLLASFGAPYADYVRRTPRLLPDFRLLDDGGEVLVQPARVAVTLRDASVFFVAWPFFGLIALLQGSGHLPVLARLW